MNFTPLPGSPAPPRCVRSGVDLIERAMRPLFVVFVSPAFDDHAGFPDLLRRIGFPEE